MEEPTQGGALLKDGSCPSVREDVGGGRWLTYSDMDFGIRLICHCKPDQACHGDSLITLGPPSSDTVRFLVRLKEEQEVTGALRRTKEHLPSTQLAWSGEGQPGDGSRTTQHGASS